MRNTAVHQITKLYQQNLNMMIYDDLLKMLH